MNKIKGIFADIDNTLIFSDSFIHKYSTAYGENSEFSTKDLIEVDDSIARDGTPHKWYCNKELVSYLLKQEYFIPVTARSITRYKDIVSLTDNVTYAITSCGGNILMNGNPLSEYRNSLNIDCDNLYYIADRIRGKVVDDSYVIANQINWYDIKEFIDSYRCEVDGMGVITIMPKGVGKDVAVRYLVKKLGIEEVICCGDNQHDYRMLSLADKSFVPATSELGLNGEDYMIYSPFQSQLIKYL